MGATGALKLTHQGEEGAHLFREQDQPALSTPLVINIPLMRQGPPPDCPPGFCPKRPLAPVTVWVPTS